MNYFGSAFLGTGLLLGMFTHALSAEPPAASAQPVNQLAQPSAQPLAQPSAQPGELTPAVTPSAAEQLDLDPQILENSPVLQRWTEEVPNVLSDIRNDPSFRTRIRLGYSQFSSSDSVGGIHVGIEDVFVPKTHLTVSADYQASLGGGSLRVTRSDRQSFGSELRYYALPLGSSVNIAPVVGYRSLQSDQYQIDGVNVGLRLQLQLSRTGAADIALSQSWVNPGSDHEEVGLTTLTFGYALTHHLRLSTDLRRQNAPQHKDSGLGIGLEWML
jgi:hypothetical protein